MGEAKSKAAKTLVVLGLAFLVALTIAVIWRDIAPKHTWPMVIADVFFVAFVFMLGYVWYDPTLNTRTRGYIRVIPIGLVLFTGLWALARSYGPPMSWMFDGVLSADVMWLIGWLLGRAKRPVISEE
jgi:hypothetical protein